MEERESSKATVLGFVVVAVLVVLACAAFILIQRVASSQAARVASEARSQAMQSRFDAERAAAEANEGAAKEFEADQKTRADQSAGVMKSVSDLLLRADQELQAGRADGARALVDAALAAIDRAEGALPVMQRSALGGEAGRLLERLGDRKGAGIQFRKAAEAIVPEVGEQHPEVRRLRGAAERVEEGE